MELSRKSLGLYFGIGDAERRESRMICWLERCGRGRIGGREFESHTASGDSVMHWKLAVNMQSGHQSWSGGKEVVFTGRQSKKEDFC